MSKLIADVGSSSSKWTYIHDSGIIENSFHLQAYNPFIHNQEVLHQLVEAVFKNQAPSTIQQLYYYGTGIKSEKQAQLIVDAFKDLSCEVYSDTLGSARSLCQRDKGIVCLLGTGSNCSYYDGSKLSQKTQALGYPLGDEGSGNHIGRLLVQQFFYNKMPKDLHTSFEEKYQLAQATDFLKQLKNQESESAYLAHFTHFAKEHESHPFIQHLLTKAFQDFFDAHVANYSSEVPLYCNGSIAVHFEDRLREVAQQNQRRISKIQQNALKGLIAYHSL